MSLASLALSRYGIAVAYGIYQIPILSSLVFWKIPVALLRVSSSGTQQIVKKVVNEYQRLLPVKDSQNLPLFKYEDGDTGFLVYEYSDDIVLND